ncbi:TolC family protein [Arenimonas oryziterrae]|uniref:Transporter n=1 Tax=Arenimonas oryziterrae DSM 21050 = YC6267 TaxID=1121015 RepID=A0A091AS20_9GAMM|nr:TolC family protein [Arenimonas oryziterrae]KFN42963.1 hypothetical protein N789_12630 [Arenimonas oryziterrae DSM 21050 = YC6267]
MIAVIRRAPLALAVLLALAGCATVPRQVSTDEIDALLLARNPPVATVPSNLSEATENVTAEPLTLPRAQHFAVLNSPRLQIEYARLGIARSDVLDATRLANPRFSYGRLRPGDGLSPQITRGLFLPLADLLLLPARGRLAKADYQRAKFDIAASLHTLSLDVDGAWYTYVGAQQVADMRKAVADGMAVSAELAQRFYDAGNISELQLRQEQAAASEARIAAGRASSEALLARLDLNQKIGLSGEQAAWQVVDRLPMPVTSEDDVSQLQSLGQSQRLDLLAARQQVRVLEDAARVSHRWRWLGGAEIGYTRESDSDGLRLRGPEVALELPVFNQGQGKVARAEALLLQARSELAQRQLEADNAVRLQAERVRVLRKIVQVHRDSLIPQRETVVARSQQQQNFMLIGAFELIQAKTREYDAYQSYLESIRDYWLARVELTRAVGAQLPSAAGATADAPQVQDILTPKGDGMQGMDHGAHDMSGMPSTDHSEHDDAGMEGMDHTGGGLSGMDEPDRPESPPDPPAAPPPAPAAPEKKPESASHDHNHGDTP